MIVLDVILALLFTAVTIAACCSGSVDDHGFMSDEEAIEEDESPPPNVPEYMITHEDGRYFIYRGSLLIDWIDEQRAIQLTEFIKNEASEYPPPNCTRCHGTGKAIIVDEDGCCRHQKCPECDE